MLIVELINKSGNTEYFVSWFLKPGDFFYFKEFVFYMFCG